MGTPGVSDLLAALPPELAELLEGPSIMHLATRNAALEPLSTLAYGLRVAKTRHLAPGEVTVFLPETLAPVQMTNLRDNGQMALTIVRPSDHRSIQIKGMWLGERRADDDDRAFIARYRDALTQELGQVGVPRSIWRRLIWWPSLALRMEVRELYVQTPGPGAGRRYGSPVGAA